MRAIKARPRPWALTCTTSPRAITEAANVIHSDETLDTRPD